MPGLWQHNWRPVQFCLIVDDFGIEYVGIEHFNHLLMLLKKHHQIQTNMAGDKIAGINVQWDIPGKRVRIDMQTYINNLLLTLNWPRPRKPQLSPFIATPIAYSRKRSSLWMKTDQLYSHPNTFGVYRRSLGHSCTTQEPWTTSYLLRSMPLPCANLKQLCKRNS